MTHRGVHDDSCARIHQGATWELSARSHGRLHGMFHEFKELLESQYEERVIPR